MANSCIKPFLIGMEQGKSKRLHFILIKSRSFVADCWPLMIWGWGGGSVCAEAKPFEPVLQPGSLSSPAAAPVRPWPGRAALSSTAGSPAGLQSAEQQACHAHSSLGRAARGGGNKAETTPDPAACIWVSRPPAGLTYEQSQRSHPRQGSACHSQPAPRSTSTPCARRGGPRAGGRRLG